MSPILPIGLAYTALVLVCVKQPRRTLAIVWIIVAVAALTLALTSPRLDSEYAFTVCWVAVLASAGTAIALRNPPRPIVLALATATGVASGLVAASSGSPLPLVAGAPTTILLLLALVRHWRGLTLLVRVVAAWIAAIALLSLTIPLVTTPGYRSDHRE